MKEIRQVYISQKKKEVRNHFILVGLATALLGVLALATEHLNDFRNNDDGVKA